MDEEKELSESELKELVLDMLNKNTTIEDAIAQKKEDDLLLKKSFWFCNKTCRAVNLYRKRALIVLEFASIRLHLIKLYSMILNPNVTEILADTINKVEEICDKYIEEKKLLNSIKKALSILKKHEVIECNYDILILLSAINDLNEKLMLALNDYMESNTMAINGIRYYGNKTYNDDIIALEAEINARCMRLGLTNKKELSESGSDNKN